LDCVTVIWRVLLISQQATALLAWFVAMEGTPPFFSVLCVCVITWQLSKKSM